MKGSTSGTLGYGLFWLLEMFSYCAVDGFAIISGYIASNKPRKYEKLVDMWFQAFFYSFVVTLILTVVGFNESWGKADIIKCALPVTSGKFWYFTAYFALFIAMPILNKFIFALDENASKKALIILIVLFSVMGTLGDPFKTAKGYSAIWLIVLYCVGALAKRAKLFAGRKSITLILMGALCIIVTWAMCIFAKKDRLLSYVSPTILLSGMIMVVLFSRLHLKGKIIAKLSPLAFGIYLFQLNQVVWNKVIKDAASFVVSKNIVSGILYVFGIAFAIFICGLLVEFVRSKLAKLFKIPSLSKRIVALVDKLLVKGIVLMK